MLNGKKNDPYDTYDFILENKGDAELQFFFLFGKYSKYDKNCSVKNTKFRELIKNLSLKAEIGLHPSYYSLENPEKIKQEKKELENVIGKKINISRQHYLRMNFPKTFIYLAESGIKDDFSMAFADQIGFRAGTSLPFQFYDLNTEKPLAITIHPSAIMDATLKYYKKWSPEMAIEESGRIITEIKKEKGIICLHWHNESLSDIGLWKGWRNVFLDQLRSCR